MSMNNDDNKRDKADQRTSDHTPEVMLPQNNHPTDDDEEEINDPNFYDGYECSQDVYFAQRNEPTFTFNDGRVGVNACCVRKLSNADYVQILVNREKKMLAIRPCDEYDIFPFRWCNEKNGKRYPRCVVGRLFHLKICDLMGWNPQDRYRVFGMFKRANGEEIILFNLNSIHVFPRYKAKDGKMKSSKIGFMQERWKDTFGIPFTDREKAMQISFIEGFSRISLFSNEEQIIEKSDFTE